METLQEPIQNETNETPNLNTIEGMIEQKEIDVQEGNAFPWELEELREQYRDYYDE